MSEPAADVAATVEYSMDKWVLDRAPWAMWFAVAGLAVVLNTDSRGRNAAALAFVYLALLGLAFAGWAATTLIDRSTPFLVSLVAGIVIIVLVVVVIGVVAGNVGRSTPRGTLLWTGLVHPPLPVFGWMLIYLGLGYIAFGIYRHFYPGRPIVALSPAGVTYHRSWLKDVHIPWQDIQGVGHLDISGSGHASSVNPNAIVVLVTRDFYERAIAPKRSFLSPPGSEYMFRPKGELMQMILTSQDVTAPPEDYRAPLEARWTAFRGVPRGTGVPAGSQAQRVRYGRWSIDGSWWQRVMFALPAVGLVAVMVWYAGVGG